MVIAVAGLVISISATVANRDGIAFTATAIAVTAVTTVVFGAMYPYLMPTTLADGVSLDIWNSASNPYTLKIMTWTALVITPLVIAYQAWTYWVFRKRLMAERKVS